MNRQDFIDKLESHPVIAAVKGPEGLQQALGSDCPVVFALYGDVLSISGIAQRIRGAGKTAFLHMDLIEGLSARDVSVDFIRENTCADGIISTRPGIVRHAGAVGLLAVQRFFLLDSLAIENIRKQYARDAASAIEVLPGLMPRIISRIQNTLREPLIAGGLISNKDDVISALRAGAMAVSSTNPEVWSL